MAGITAKADADAFDATATTGIRAIPVSYETLFVTLPITLPGSAKRDIMLTGIPSALKIS